MQQARDGVPPPRSPNPHASCCGCGQGGVSACQHGNRCPPLAASPLQVWLEGMLLCGGGSSVPGLGARLLREMRGLAPQSVAPGIYGVPVRPSSVGRLGVGLLLCLLALHLAWYSWHSRRGPVGVGLACMLWVVPHARCHTARPPPAVS